MNFQYRFPLLHILFVRDASNIHNSTDDDKNFPFV